MTMVLDMRLNHITCHLVANRAHKVTISPKSPSSKFSFELKISPKYFLRTHNFQYSYHLTKEIIRRDSLKHFPLILSYLYLKHFKVLSDQYFFKQFLGRLSDLIAKNPLSIFGRKNKVISSFIHCMTQSFYSHAADYANNSDRENPFLIVVQHLESRIRFS